MHAEFDSRQHLDEIPLKELDVDHDMFASDMFANDPMEYLASVSCIGRL